MPVVLLGLLGLAVVALGLFWMLRANPSSLARIARLVLVFAALLGVGGGLLFGMRFLPSIMPELMGLAGLVVTGLVARWLRNRPSGGFSSPGTGGRTEVRTTFLQAWIDHGTGDVGGTVLSGRFAGRTLDALADGDLLLLHDECRGDADSVQVLEAYLDRRLGPGWRTGGAQDEASPPRGARSDMSREEALAVLGLAEGASPEEVKAAHRRLIQRVHPDVGGSADLAARINRAKDILLGGR